MSLRPSSISRNVHDVHDIRVIHGSAWLSSVAVRNSVTALQRWPSALRNQVSGETCSHFTAVNRPGHLLC